MTEKKANALSKSKEMQVNAKSYRYELHFILPQRTKAQPPHKQLTNEFSLDIIVNNPCKKTNFAN